MLVRKWRSKTDQAATYCSDGDLFGLITVRIRRSNHNPVSDFPSDVRTDCDLVISNKCSSGEFRPRSCMLLAVQFESSSHSQYFVARGAFVDDHLEIVLLTMQDDVGSL